MPRTVYVSFDGEQFNTYQEAENHELELFEEWYRSNPNISVAPFLESVVCRDRANVRDALKQYFFLGYERVE